MMLAEFLLDLKGTFDWANGHIIPYELANLSVAGAMLGRFSHYLSERCAKVWYQRNSFVTRYSGLGTLQGGVPSACLMH